MLRRTSLGLLALLIVLGNFSCGKEEAKTEAPVTKEPAAEHATKPKAEKKEEKTIFVDLSFEDAKKEAAKGDKLVFLDYYTTWCVPCKKLETSTFIDPKVMEWMTEHAVSLKVDAEKKKKLAEQYSAKTYPTLVFVKSDGTELKRIGKYVDAETFLKTAQEAYEARTKAPAEAPETTDD